MFVLINLIVKVGASVHSLIARRRVEKRSGQLSTLSEVENICVLPDQHWHCLEDNLG